MEFVQHLPKNQRYTIGARIDNRLLDLLELTHTAYLINQANMAEKISAVNACIFELDKIKFLTQIAWESKLLGQIQFAELGSKLDEIGRMLGGWRNKLLNPEKKNRNL